jgi:hypothetical protein
VRFCYAIAERRKFSPLLKMRSALP